MILSFKGLYSTGGIKETCQLEAVMKLISLLGGVAAMGIAIGLAASPISASVSLLTGCLVMFGLGLVGLGSMISDGPPSAPLVDE